jgi:hypothetical protein
MANFFTNSEAAAFNEADASNTIPAGDHSVKILSIEPLASNPDVKCFIFEIVGGPHARRQLRAWPSTARDLIWTTKKLIGAVTSDPQKLQLEDLVDHTFTAEVTVEERRDTGEKVNRVVRLLPLRPGHDAPSGAASDFDEGIPF